jgi:hypothetical protein
MLRLSSPIHQNLPRPKNTWAYRAFVVGSVLTPPQPLSVEDGQKLIRREDSHLTELGEGAKVLVTADEESHLG